MSQPKYSITFTQFNDQFNHNQRLLLYILGAFAPLKSVHSVLYIDSGLDCPQSLVYNRNLLSAPDSIYYMKDSINYSQQAGAYITKLYICSSRYVVR